jgi:hypothetical protein
MIVIGQTLVRKALAERRAAGVPPIGDLDYTASRGLASQTALHAQRKT